MGIGRKVGEAAFEGLTTLIRRAKATGAPQDVQAVSQMLKDPEALRRIFKVKPAHFSQLNKELADYERAFGEKIERDVFEGRVERRGMKPPVLQAVAGGAAATAGAKKAAAEETIDLFAETEEPTGDDQAQVVELFAEEGDVDEAEAVEGFTEGPSLPQRLLQATAEGVGQVARHPVTQAIAKHPATQFAKEVFFDFPAEMGEAAVAFSREDPVKLVAEGRFPEALLAAEMRGLKRFVAPGVLPPGLSENILPEAYRKLNDFFKEQQLSFTISAGVDPLNVLLVPSLLMGGTKAGLRTASAIRAAKQTPRAVHEAADQVVKEVAKELGTGLKPMVRIAKQDTLRHLTTGEPYQVVSVSNKTGDVTLQSINTGDRVMFKKADLGEQFQMVTLNRERVKDVAESHLIKHAMEGEALKKQPQVRLPKTGLDEPAEALAWPRNRSSFLARFAVVEKGIAMQGQTGRQLSAQVKQVRSVAEARAGTAIADYVNTAQHLTKAQRLELAAALDRNIPVKDAAVRAAFRVSNQARRAIAQESQSLNLLQRLRSGEEVPFTPRKYYYPHIVPKPDAPKEVITDVIQNAVRMGAFESELAAREAWAEYKGFVQHGRRLDKFLDWMVDHGRARNRSDARYLMERFVNRNRVQRATHLERARELDFPFWDPDPSRVLPEYYAQAFKRLERVKTFGPRDEVAKDLIHQIALEGGDATYVREAFDRIMKPPIQQHAFGVIPPKLTANLRALQVVTKMGLSAALNAPQGLLNSYIKTGVRPTALALRDSLTQGGRDFALRSGAILEGTVHELLQETGPSTRMADAFLKRTGFSATERFNRILSANAAKHYIPRLLGRVKANAKDGIALRELERLGISADAARSGKLTAEQTAAAANRFVNLTQFRSAAQDLPLFASTPEGRLMFQFKSFVFGFTRFASDSILSEARAGNFRPLTRYLIAGGLTGEAVRDVVDSVRANPRPENPMIRYLENLSTVGGVGIFTDILKASMRGGGGALLELAAGPTLTETTDLVGNMVRALTGKPKPLITQLTRQVPVVGPTIRNVVLPSEALEREQEPRLFPRSRKSRVTVPLFAE
jgi:hypothetical protein